MGRAKHILFTTLAIGLALVLDAAGLARDEERGTEEVTLAVIVNPDNPVEDLKFRDLRKLLRLDKQFWEKDRRCVLYLPPTDSKARTVLLAEVYDMSEEELRKYWITKVFSGEIPREPSVARTTKAAGILVGKAPGGLSVVPATQVPKGVKVLRIDGKKPGDEGYPMVGEVEAEGSGAAASRDGAAVDGRGGALSAR